MQEKETCKTESNCRLQLKITTLSSDGPSTLKSLSHKIWGPKTQIPVVQKHALKTADTPLGDSVILFTLLH